MSTSDIQFTVYHRRSALLKLSYLLLAIGAAFFVLVFFNLIELKGKGFVVLSAILLASSMGLLRGYGQEKPFLLFTERTLMIQSGIGFHYQAIPKESIEQIKLVKYRGAHDYIGVFLYQGRRHLLDRTYWARLWMWLNRRFFGCDFIWNSVTLNIHHLDLLDTLDKWLRDEGEP